MTYPEIARAFAMKVESAKRLVRRNHWRRLAGNDRRVRIAVPLSALDTGDGTANGTPDHPGDETGAAVPPAAPAIRRHGKGDGTPDAVRAIASLTTHIERLARELDAARIVITAAQGEATAAKAETERLRADLDAATAAADRLQAVLTLTESERDKWHSEALRPLLSRLFGRPAA